MRWDQSLPILVLVTHVDPPIAMETLIAICLAGACFEALDYQIRQDDTAFS